MVPRNFPVNDADMGWDLATLLANSMQGKNKIVNLKRLLRIIKQSNNKLTRRQFN